MAINRACAKWWKKAILNGVSDAGGGRETTTQLFIVALTRDPFERDLALHARMISTVALHISSWITIHKRVPIGISKGAELVITHLRISSWITIHKRVPIGISLSSKSVIYTRWLGCFPCTLFSNALLDRDHQFVPEHFQWNRYPCIYSFWITLWADEVVLVTGTAFLSILLCRGLH